MRTRNARYGKSAARIHVVPAHRSQRRRGQANPRHACPASARTRTGRSLPRRRTPPDRVRFIPSCCGDILPSRPSFPATQTVAPGVAEQRRAARQSHYQQLGMHSMPQVPCRRTRTRAYEWAFRARAGPTARRPPGALPQLDGNKSKLRRSNTPDAHDHLLERPLGLLWEIFLGTSSAPPAGPGMK